VVTAALLLSFNAWGQKASGKARAELKNVQGQNVGGIHAIHIQEAGKCDAPDFKTAGGHCNPASEHHGSLNRQGEHAGELGKLTVAANGTAKAKLAARGVTLAWVDFIIGDTEIRSEFNARETARPIYEALPIESSGSYWGGELCFPAPVEAPRAKDAREVVEPGSVRVEAGTE